LNSKWALVLFCILLNGCVGVSTKSIQNDARILVVSQSTNEYKLTHMSFNIFPSFRDLQSTIVDPGWTVSSLFNDLVEQNTQDSRFDYIFAEAPLDPEAVEDEALTLAQLAKANRADYVLFLKTSVAKNNIGVNTQGSHYGYVHETVKLFDDIGRVFANIHVTLYDASTLESTIVRYRTCGRLEVDQLVFERTEEPLTLPASLINLDLKEALIAEEIETATEATKAIATEEIMNAISGCRLGQSD